MTWSNKSIRTIQFSCFCTLLGWAFLHFYGNPPYRIIFWNESILKPIVEGLFSLSWSNYVRSGSVDKSINLFIKSIGVFLLISAFSSLTKKNKFQLYLLIASSLSLVFLFFCGFLDKGFQLPYFIEHALQMGAPLLFLLALYKKKYTIIAKVFIASTFIGHGIYAMGIYPRPGGFVDMMINILSIKEQTATFYLVQLGLIDFIVAVFIFVKRFEKYALIYCFAWGILTAFARIFAYHENFFQWAPETMIRFVHGLIPLALYFDIKASKKSP